MSQHKVASIVGSVAVLLLTLAATIGGIGVKAIFCACGLATGYVAYVLFWATSIESFEDSLNVVATRLTQVDRLWRLKANAATWPPHLTYPYSDGLHEWARRNASYLNDADADIYAIAKVAYSDDAFHDQVFDSARRAMRRTVDLWASGVARVGFGARRWLKPAIREHRPDLIVFAYLEIALAEKLFTPGAAPGQVGRWASLGEQWSSLADRDASVPWHTQSLSGLSRSQFEIQMASLSGDARTSLEALIDRGHADVRDDETSPLRDVERATDFLMRGPKDNTITRYLLSPGRANELRTWRERRRLRT